MYTAVTPFNKGLFVEFSMNPQCLFRAGGTAFHKWKKFDWITEPKVNLLPPQLWSVRNLTQSHLLLFIGQDPLQFFSTVANHYTVMTTLMVGSKNPSAVVNCESQSGWN